MCLLLTDAKEFFFLGFSFFITLARTAVLPKGLFIILFSESQLLLLYEFKYYTSNIHIARQGIDLWKFKEVFEDF